MFKFKKILRKGVASYIHFQRRKRDKIIRSYLHKHDAYYQSLNKKYKKRSWVNYYASPYSGNYDPRYFKRSFNSSNKYLNRHKRKEFSDFIRLTRKSYKGTKHGRAYGNYHYSGHGKWQDYQRAKNSYFNHGEYTFY